MCESLYFLSDTYRGVVSKILGPRQTFINPYYSLKCLNINAYFLSLCMFGGLLKQLYLLPSKQRKASVTPSFRV